MNIKPLRIAPTAAWEAIVRPLDVLLRDLVAAVNAGPFRRVACVIDTDALPVSVELPTGARPFAVTLDRAVVQSTADGVVISGGAVSWSLVAGAVRIHSLPALAASTRYDAVIAVWEA